MNSAQIVNQVFKRKRTLSTVYPRQKKAVLFAFFFLCAAPVLGTCVLGEINHTMAEKSGTLYFPDVSKYTVVFETSYGELCMNMEAAIACMLPAIVPPDYEEETMKAQAILLRTELLKSYEAQEEKAEYEIYLNKTPYEKIYFTFLEQKKVYGENYSGNLAVYRHAALETAGMYLRDADNEDFTEAGKAACTGWFLVSTGTTREGILCEKDYQSEDYYNETIVTRREFQKVMEDLYRESQTTEAKEKKEPKEIHFQGAEEKISCSVLLEDGTYDTLEVSPEKFCQSLGLLSPFVEDITEADTQVTITVKGVGHGSGMSVFYANELAKEGRSYSEILNYFFTNIAIDKFE